MNGNGGGALTAGVDYSQISLGGNLTIGSAVTLTLSLDLGHPLALNQDYFLFNLTDSSAFTLGQFATLSDGTNSAAFDNNRVTLNGQDYVIGYAGDFATGAFTGGNDIVLMAVPEPETWAMLAGGAALLLLGQRRRRAA